MSTTRRKLDLDDRTALLARVIPIFADGTADHVTLAAGVSEDAVPPGLVDAMIIGHTDHGRGVKAVVGPDPRLAPSVRGWHSSSHPLFDRVAAREAEGSNHVAPKTER